MRRVVSHTCLSLSEVIGLDRPALFFDFGESLLYEDGALYDLHERVAGGVADSPPERLPSQILERGTGIEYGWHHLLDCDCSLCARSRALSF